jgi:hypothetical protein
LIECLHHLNPELYSDKKGEHYVPVDFAGILPDFRSWLRLASSGYEGSGFLAEKPGSAESIA